MAKSFLKIIRDLFRSPIIRAVAVLIPQKEARNVIFNENVAKPLRE